MSKTILCTNIVKQFTTFFFLTRDSLLLLLKKGCKGGSPLVFHSEWVAGYTQTTGALKGGPLEFVGASTIP